MKKENYFKSDRWTAGIDNLLQKQLGQSFDTPEEIAAGQIDGSLQLVLVPVANLALTYYDRRIRAFFARANIDIGADVLTVEAIQKKIETSTGLEIAEFSAAGLLLALEKPLARALSEALGFVVTKVFDKDELHRQVKEHVIQRLADGEGGGVIREKTLHKLREAATWAKNGLGEGERKKVLNRAYQRRYRKGHAQTWV